MNLWTRFAARRGAPDEPPDTPTPDRGPTVVEQLRQRRVALGLTAADVERDTRINRLYIDALESADFQVLPAPVYARGFMRSYARYLGLDPERAVAEIPRDLPRPIGLEPLPGLRRSSPVPMAIRLPISPRVPRSAVWVAAAIVLLVLLGLTAMRLRGDGELGLSIETPSPSASTAPVASATVPPFAPGSTPNFRGVARATAVGLAGGLGLQVELVDQADQAAPGTVVGQLPAPGAPVQFGDVVTLFISTGPG